VKSSLLSQLAAVLVASPAVLAITFAAAPAQAATAIAGDLDYALPLDSDEADSGGGFAIRIGQQVRLPLIALTPEIGFTYASFSEGPTAYRGIAGLRLGVGEVLRPGVFAHLGIGRLSLPDPLPSHTAFSYDAGVFLDFTLLPLLDIGVHGAYNRVNGKDEVSAFEWVTLGAHAALIF
jgi:hypothetical protein